MNSLIRAARRAGRVTRYHTSTLVKGEDVAQHTFNMMNLLMVMLNGQVSPALLKAALLHDQGEYVTGDIPSPVKRAMKLNELDIMETAAINYIHYAGSPSLTEWEHLLLKVADNLDGLLKCTEELRLGNYELDMVGKTYVSYLNELLPSLGGGGVATMVINAIHDFTYLGDTPRD